MNSVFEIPWYCLTYEQAALDLGSHEEFARTAIREAQRIAPRPKKSLVIDVGCATGISTKVLLEEISGIEELAAMDQEDAMLNLARYKFDHTTERPFNSVLSSGTHYPPIIAQHTRVEDLHEHLRRVRRQTSQKTGKVSFLHYRAEDITDHLRGEEVDLVFAHRMLRWPRRLNYHPGDQPNFVHEQKVMDGIHHWVKSGGLFVYTLTGEDVLFSNAQWDAYHFTRHPFYLEFMQGLRNELGTSVPSENHLDFREEEVYALASQNGFFIRGFGGVTKEYRPEQLLEVCFAQGYTDIFLKYGLETPPEHISHHLGKALEYALERAKPEDAPVRETGIHVIAQRN